MWHCCDLDGEAHMTAPALNDAAVTHGAVSRLVDIMLYCDGRPVTKYRADGLIAATPTRLHRILDVGRRPDNRPQARLHLRHPDLPTHALRQTAGILRQLELEIENMCPDTVALYLTVDGSETYRLRRGDRVRITKSNLTAKPIRLNSKSGSIRAFTVCFKENNGIMGA